MKKIALMIIACLCVSCQSFKEYARRESSIAREERLEREAQEEVQRKEQENRRAKAQTEQIEDIRFAKIVETIKENSYKVDPFQRYKLYTTANIYNSLLLDTQTGIIKQVQWSFELEKEYSIYINSEDLTCNTGCGSFELYPTKNIYTYILLDKISGRKWHVQWGFEEENCWIRRIY